MEETKSIDRDDLVLGLFLDSMTTNFPNQVGIDEQVEDILKEDNKQKMATSILTFLPQEQCVLPYQRPAQSYQNSKQKQISKGNKDQERRRPCYDPIPVSYAHVLPILVKVGAIMPKQIEPAKFPYSHKHDPHATCGYHAGYVGHSTETCHVLKARVQELIDQKLLSFTPAIAEVPVEKRARLGFLRFFDRKLELPSKVSLGDFWKFLDRLPLKCKSKGVFENEWS
ncbi:hypothetical protein KIW84_012778 [Lathyrus oleraceus]|uniref:Uncharacterized protein n=1 Tax=Pisum sativum TaxID=3888 RepID=A0A9D5BIQ9_PEA|nr:hypothetical protein KIW84_012778 [Pisum sativum]